MITTIILTGHHHHRHHYQEIKRMTTALMTCFIISMKRQLTPTCKWLNSQTENESVHTVNTFTETISIPRYGLALCYSKFWLMSYAQPEPQLLQCGQTQCYCLSRSVYDTTRESGLLFSLTIAFSVTQADLSMRLSPLWLLNQSSVVRTILAPPPSRPLVAGGV